MYGRYSFILFFFTHFSMQSLVSSSSQGQRKKKMGHSLQKRKNMFSSRLSVWINGLILVLIFSIKSKRLEYLFLQHKHPFLFLPNKSNTCLFVISLFACWFFFIFRFCQKKTGQHASKTSRQKRAKKSLRHFGLAGKIRPHQGVYLLLCNKTV